MAPAIPLDGSVCVDDRHDPALHSGLLDESVRLRGLLQLHPFGDDLSDLSLHQRAQECSQILTARIRALLTQRTGR